jgi:hypothetical protein
VGLGLFGSLPTAAQVLIFLIHWINHRLVKGRMSSLVAPVPGGLTAHFCADAPMNLTQKTIFACQFPHLS